MAECESSVVTAIEPQARRPNRVSVFVDGEFALGMDAEVAAEVGLRVGQRITRAELEALVRREERRRARESALRWLGTRARSRQEIVRRLQRQGYAPDLVEEVAASLARSGLIDDAEFSRSWVRARTGSRPMGRARIAAELRQKGVDPEVIREALQPLDPDREAELALAVGRSKVEQLRGEDLPTARRKLGQFLLRRGFSWEVVTDVVDRLLRDEG